MVSDLTFLTFLKTHETDIASLVRQKDQGEVEVFEIEANITKVIVQMHDTVVKILNENKITEKENNHDFVNG